MREPVLIKGSFVREGEKPVAGRVRFTPSIIWVYEDSQAWPCLAPEVELDKDGRFEVEVTPTNLGVIPFHYTVDTPAGSWKIKVEKDSLLSELLPTRRET